MSQLLEKAIINGHENVIVEYGHFDMGGEITSPRPPLRITPCIPVWALMGGVQDRATALPAIILDSSYSSFPEKLHKMVAPYCLSVCEIVRVGAYFRDLKRWPHVIHTQE